MRIKDRRGPSELRVSVAYLCGVLTGVLGMGFFAPDSPPWVAREDQRGGLVPAPPGGLRPAPLELLRRVAADEPEPDDRPTMDAQHVRLRREGFVPWDGLSESERLAVHNVVATYRIVHDQPIERQLQPMLVFVHPRDRDALDRFAELARAELARAELEGDFEDVVQRLVRAGDDHCEVITLRVRDDDPRIVNGPGAFVTRWLLDRDEPGFFEYAGHERRDDATDVRIRRVRPGADAALDAFAEQSRAALCERVALADKLFPLVYHQEVK